MKQTPAHEQHNPSLLSLIPHNSKKIIEVGCSSGALAREFKKISPDCHYLGIEIDPEYTELAKRHCDKAFTLDIERAAEQFWLDQADRDCWIFGDTLEHLKDPWSVLRKIRARIPESGSVVVCVPNAQHWSIQVKLSIGHFRYEDNGLLDRTHLRWFTRQTLIELFDDTGFEIETGMPLVPDDPNSEQFLGIIEQMAKTAGIDPKIAVADSLPYQYVIRAVPK